MEMLAIKMSNSQKVFVILCIIGTTLADKVVMTNSGPVQGITVQTDEAVLEAYLGVPYAEPPVGRLRFQKPVPKMSWLGVYDASRNPPPCIQNVTEQFYYTPNVENMTEDCLYLNIWAPYSSLRSKSKPVLFFIHGGAFNIGSSNMKLYDGAKLAGHGDVLVVTINYRVGVMGFFSAFSEDAIGNSGIYDQILALKWVKNNIKSFGGDPDHIVLIGESAGAMSAAAHLASPLTSHLFKRVILQSGAAITPIILDDNDRLYKTSQRLANIVGCADKTVTLATNPRLIVSCLKRLSAIELSSAEGILMKNNPITFFPRIGDSYMPNDPVQIIRRGLFDNVEMLIGVNKDEGTFFLTAAVPQYFGVYGINNVQTVSKRLAYQITRVIYQNTEQKKESEIAAFYINNIQNATSDIYTKAISESIGDYMITCNSIFHADFHSMKKNPVYFYVFSHRPSSTPLAEWMGSTHFDEVQYVFGNPMHSNFTPEEVEMSRRIMDRWLAFAKTGDPNIPDELKWPLYSYYNPEYLDIDIEESVRLRPTNHRCEFWRDRFHTVIDDELIEALSGSAGTHVTSLIILLTVSIMFSFYWIST